MFAFADTEINVEATGSGTAGKFGNEPTIFDNFKESTNKKEVCKELFPIFLFIIYMIWTLISCYQAARKNRAFYGTSYRKEGYFMYINYAGFFFCAMLVYISLEKIKLLGFFFFRVFNC